jgi:hypothetical protein
MCSLTRCVPLLLFALFTCSGVAQVRFGLKAGATLTTFVQKPETWPGGSVERYAALLDPVYLGDGLYAKGTNTIEVDNATGWGFLFGGYMDVPARQALSVRMELNYSVRSVTGDFVTPTIVQDLGADADPNFTIRQATDASGTFRQDLGYLEVPLLAGFQVSKGPRFHVGFGAAFLLGGRSNYRGVTNTITWREDPQNSGDLYAVAISETHNTTDVSYAGKEATLGLNSVEWAAVVGMELPFSEAFSLGIRYWHGLSSVEVSTAYPEGPTPESYHQVLQFTLGIGLSPAEKHVPAAASE